MLSSVLGSFKSLEVFNNQELSNPWTQDIELQAKILQKISMLPVSAIIVHWEGIAQQKPTIITLNFENMEKATGEPGTFWMNYLIHSILLSQLFDYILKINFL